MKKLLLLIFPILLFSADYKIYFKGNKTFDNKTLYSELGFEQKFIDKILFRKFNPKVKEKLLDSIKEELLLFYKQEGFWKAKIEFKKDKKRKIATFIIKENHPIIIKNIEITSNFDIKKFINFKKGERFSIKKFKNSKELIKKALLNRGYCSYDFRPKAYIFSKKDIAYLVYYLNRGDICKIKTIDVKGLKTISKKVVLSHIYLKPNEKFSLERVEESYKKLYSLEYFNNVIIDYSKKINNQIFADIDIKERKKVHIYRAGIGYESLNGAHLNFSYKNLNFHQKQLNFDFLYSKNIKSASFKVFTPAVELFEKNYDLVNEVEHREEKYDSFDEKKSKIGASILLDRFKFSYQLSLFWDYIKIYNSSDLSSNGYFNIVYPKFSFIYDRRDSKIFPKNGFYAKNSIEGSLKMISNVSYVKNLSEIGFYKSFDDITIFLRGRVGIIDDFQGKLPASKLFYAGGLNSNRAYGFHKISAVDSTTEQGGKSLLETTIEPTFPLYKKLRGAVFWDRTILSKKKLNFNVKPINSIGFGFRYPTMIGNLAVDFGFDTAHLGQHAMIFNIGATF